MEFKINGIYKNGRDIFVVKNIEGNLLEIMDLEGYHYNTILKQKADYKAYNGPLPTNKIEETIENLPEEIKKDIERWIHIAKEGSGDPSWSDGCNLNLKRNHIVFGQKRLKNLCSTFGYPTPSIASHPLPPVMDNDWNAKELPKINHSDKAFIATELVDFELCLEEEKKSSFAETATGQLMLCS